ncbi:CAP domain-containing protein [Yanshouia hominis]|uniref:CAP domain-containing protein n=1 Tax=Yanshouia hominis TaxID=2763673 RepID=A0ABR7NNC5_9FIRM|nr:CAP domain-containing protein [Yanshouia hominis]MBC8577317.1 CAP domain-containing protein [Yanshouia hominis]
MKRSLKRTMAVIIALCCSLAGGTMAYAAEGDSEWGVIPDGYVLFVPSAQSTVIAETAPDSGRETQKTPPASQTDKLPEGSDSSENIQSQPGHETVESGCAYTLEEFAAAHLAEINRVREENGLPALVTDLTLTEMAQERIEEYRWGHKRGDGSEWYTIFEEYETSLRAAGENWIGSGNNPYSQIEALMRSDGHRANILNEDAVYAGIGVQWNDEKTAISVVQLFAK